MKLHYSEIILMLPPVVFKRQDFFPMAKDSSVCVCVCSPQIRQKLDVCVLKSSVFSSSVPASQTFYTVWCCWKTTANPQHDRQYVGSIMFVFYISNNNDNINNNKRWHLSGFTQPPLQTQKALYDLFHTCSSKHTLMCKIGGFSFNQVVLIV